MEAQQILDIKRAEDLFSGDIEAVKKKHRDLAKEWHPDKNKSKKADAVFQKVSFLYEEALKKIEEGCWGYAGRALLYNKKGKGGWSLNYHIKHAFELGEYYVGDHSVVYLVDKEHKKLFSHGQAMIETLQYPSKKVELECKRYLPTDIEVMETKEGKFAMAVKKTPDLLPLRDVLKHYEGKLHPTQAAWILSTLYNLGCYLWTSGVAHNDISFGLVLHLPELHSGALLGGWWYAGATRRGDQIPS
jgi:hypothetical protein